MREIKFRAWHKTLKYLSPIGSMVFGKEVEIYYPEQGDDGVNWGGGGVKWEDVEISQYTNLKDKNGVEIYENDIVKVHQFLFDGHEVENEHIGLIGYSEKMCCFVLLKIVGNFYSEHTGYKNGEDKEGCPLCLFIGLHEESWEVIGNIWENPEILEAK